MARYTLSPAAQADLDVIWDYSFRHWGVTQAETYIRDIQRACEALARGTLVSRSVEDIRAGYRKAAVGSHVMYFQVQDDVVEIIRILHQSMDVNRHL